MKLTYISIKDISSYEIVVNFPLKNLSNKTWYSIVIFTRGLKFTDFVV